MEHNPAELAGGVAIDGEGGRAAATVCAAQRARAARGAGCWAVVNDTATLHQRAKVTPSLAVTPRSPLMRANSSTSLHRDAILDQSLRVEPLYT